MNRKILYLMTTFMLVGILTGCGSLFGTSSVGSYSTSRDEAETVPKETAAPPSFEMTLPAEPVDTIILQQSETLRVEYVLTALNPYAEYVGEDVSINSLGAEALARWLLNQTTLDSVADYGDALFYQSEAAPVYSGWISPAAENTKTVRLITTENLKKCGLLDELLPLFEEEYGYSVEIVAVEDGGAYVAAAMGEADLILAPAPAEGDVFADEHYFRQIPGFAERNVPVFYCPYVLCGPEADPAGAARRADMTAAFAAIGMAECYFISQGDYSAAHMAELQLWAEKPEGDWYFSVNTETGPCLTIAEEMGGYVLADKLTYEIFRSLNGII